MIEVVYIPVGTNTGEYRDELVNKLNDGYSVIRADSYNQGLIYIIEKKDNKLSEEELNYRIEQKAIQTEMLKEIVKRDRLLKNYKDKISHLREQDRMLGTYTVGIQFDDLNNETEELLSSEVWLDKYKEEE